jgi:hypothetical protein
MTILGSFASVDEAARLVVPTEPTAIEEENYVTPPSRNIGGRAIGTTIAAKQAALTTTEALTTKAAMLYFEERQKANHMNKKVAPGTLEKILNDVETEGGLMEGTIKKRTVISRVQRNNVAGCQPQSTSPLKAVEPIVVQYCERLAEMGAPLTRDQVIDLANGLIKGTEHEHALHCFKNMRGLLSPQEKENNQALVRSSWYQSFMERNKNRLKRSKGFVKDVNRHTWCTVENFEGMYDRTYMAMVKSGIAELLEEEVLFNRDNNVVEENGFGRKSRYKITHPEYLLFCDETGSNTNMKNDGHVGGELFVLPVESRGSAVLGSATDIRFTVLPFTAGTGEPVMCAVLLKSERKVSELPLSWTAGIDITKNIRTNDNDIELFMDNSSDGEAMQGGPKCYFNGKKIPCFVGTSKKAGITSELLVQMLAFLDELNVFDRSKGILPMLLLDGHHSRLEYPFVDYVTKPDNRWTVCIGVPYGTHIWQVHDSSEMNGSFKMAVTRAKRLIMSHKPHEKKLFSNRYYPDNQPCLG